MHRAEVERRLARIKVWVRGDERAPHKPLLLLLALGRLHRGESRLAAFAEIETPLADLLASFGPARRQHHPEQPFWRLCGDGVWEIPGLAALPRSQSGDIPKGALRRARVAGGFAEPIYRALKDDVDLARDVADSLLERHFPASMHDAIRAAVGLPLARSEYEAHRWPRDPGFRQKVLRAYARRSAVCDADIRLGDALLDLDAAHVKWHSHGGPDEVPNGLALCGFHHKALDRGAWGLAGAGRGFRILVSSEANGRGDAWRWLRDFHGRSLRAPQSPELGLRTTYVEGHARQVFRNPPLP